MQYYAVECEAPGAGYGPEAQLSYDESGQYIQEVNFLDLIFDVWLGGELVQDVDCFCVTRPLWEFLASNGIKGVSVRDMLATPGEHLNDLHPDRVLPKFYELTLPRGTKASRRNDMWLLESVPDADMFTGIGLPLFVTERIKGLLISYGITGVDFEAAEVKSGS